MVKGKETDLNFQKNCRCGMVALLENLCATRQIQEELYLKVTLKLK